LPSIACVLWLVVGVCINSQQKSKLDKRNSRDAINPEINPLEVVAIQSERGNLVRPCEPQLNDAANFELSDAKFTGRLRKNRICLASFKGF